MRASAWRVGDGKPAADPLCQKISDLGVTGIASAWPVCGFSQRECSLPSLCVTRSRAGVDGGGVPRASSDDDEFLLGVGRHGSQGVLSSVFQNEGNCLAQIRQTFLTRLALAICARHFGAVSDVPWAIQFDDRRELFGHSNILPLLTVNRVREARSYDPTASSRTIPSIVLKSSSAWIGFDM
jgi:hypothetical protein